jgi:hypothetical protein
MQLHDTDKPERIYSSDKYIAPVLLLSGQWRKINVNNILKLHTSQFPSFFFNLDVFF